MFSMSLLIFWLSFSLWAFVLFFGLASEGKPLSEIPSLRAFRDVLWDLRWLGAALGMAITVATGALGKALLGHYGNAFLLPALSGIAAAFAAAYLLQRRGRNASRDTNLPR